MSVTVTLHVYSGTPDPSWELAEDQATELVRRLARLQKTTLLKPPGIIGDLGYRGLSVTSVREKLLDPFIYVHAGIVDLDRFALNRLDEHGELEKWLLTTAGNAIDSELTAYVESEIAGAATPDDATHLATVLVPPYEPERWNNDWTIRTKNNCYNYANDKITNTFAQPGRGTGQPHSAMTCENVDAAAKRDHQIPVTSPAGAPKEGQFIALAIWPRRDYHWYRKDTDNMWSHKPGQTPARNTDKSGKLIADPETCNRGPYTVWCGYFHSIPGKTIID